MEKVIVFDLGGTLMRYEGMPHSWISYYQSAFEAVRDQYSLFLSRDDILRSVDILKDYNPRYKPREIEYSAEFLFGEATRHWNTSVPLPEIIDAFFDGIHLTAKLYEDTIPALTQLKEKGWRTAALTNLPSSMPERYSRIVKDAGFIRIVRDLRLEKTQSGGAAVHCATLSSGTLAAYFCRG